MVDVQTKAPCTSYSIQDIAPPPSLLVRRLRSLAPLCHPANGQSASSSALADYHSYAAASLLALKPKIDLRHAEDAHENQQHTLPCLPSHSQADRLIDCAIARLAEALAQTALACYPTAQVYHLPQIGLLYESHGYIQAMLSHRRYVSYDAASLRHIDFAAACHECAALFSQTAV